MPLRGEVQKAPMHVSAFIAVTKFRHLSGITSEVMFSGLFNTSGSGIHSP